MRPAMPSALICAAGIGAPESRQVKFAPRDAFVPFLARVSSSGETPPVFTENRQPPFSTAGATTASLPFFDDSTKDETSGTCAPAAAGLGLATVRAHSHAMTVVSVPSASRAFG